VADASSMQQSGDVKFGIVHGAHDGAIWVLDADGVNTGVSVVIVIGLSTEKLERRKSL